MQSAALIYNPGAGSWRTGRLLAAVREALAGGGYRLEVLPTRGPGHATSLAREAAAEGIENLFVFGGDGTLREAAAGALGTPAAVAPIPGGTVNVVALALGLPRGAVAAARSLSGARTMEMDVGRCGEDIFLMQASAGLDARVMSRLQPGLKRRLGKAAVWWSALAQWLVYDYRVIDLAADGRVARASFVAACNLPYYAGAWKLAPEASTTDGVLDLLLFHGRGRRQTLGFARDLVLGRHLGRRDVELSKVRRVELRGPVGCALQLDGDALPIDLPVTVSVAPQRLRVLVPASA